MSRKHEAAEPKISVAVYLMLTKAEMATVRATGELTGRWLTARIREAIEAEAQRQASRAAAGLIIVNQEVSP